MQITEKESFRQSLLTVVPSSDPEDVSILIHKIKMLKTQPFYSVFVFMPSMMFFKFAEELRNHGIKFKQVEIKHNLAKLEVA